MSKDSTTNAASVNGTPAKPYIGGQALIEGVMMRSPKSLAMVVRRRDGSLHVRERPISDYRRGIAKIPLARGVASFVESLRLGQEALRFSTDQFEKDMEAADREAAKSVKPAKTETATKGGALAKAGKTGASTLSALSAFSSMIARAFNSSLAMLMMTEGDAPISEPRPLSREGARDDAREDEKPSALAASKSPNSSGGGELLEPEKKKSRSGMGVVLVLMVLFIWALPQIAAALSKRAFHLEMNVQSPLFQAVTGVFKLVIVISYMLFLRRTELVRRMFQYHGAEHKTISTYEAAEALTVANARAKTTLHPRCGTTFLVMVAIVSVAVFIVLGAVVPKIDTGSELGNNVVFFLMKLPLIPVIAGLTFEIQRVFARYCTTGPLRALLWPGFLVQKITTIEPDDDQLEIALASLKATLFRESGEKSGSNADVRFGSYSELLEASRLRKAA